MIYRLCASWCLASILWCNSLFAQPFSDVSNNAGFITLEDLGDGIALWGNINPQTTQSDSLLDFLVAGQTNSGFAARLYRNTGGPGMTNFGTSALASLKNPGADFGDYDNDGYLDLVLSGEDASGSTRRTYLYKGTAATSGTFTGPFTSNLEGVSDAALAWADYDHDGDLDLFLSGNNGFGAIAKIYRNDPPFFFETVTFSSGIQNGSVAWGDYNRDGELDLLYSGSGSTNAPVTRLYKNNGNALFTLVQDPDIKNVKDGSVAWADYDLDGDLDILLSGDTGSGSITEILKNDGGDQFSLAFSLTGILDGQSIWGDYDNDGYVDVCLAGMSSTGRVIQVHRNVNAGSFSNVTNPAFTAIGIPVDQASLALGDYDNDQKLDLLVTGRYFSNGVTNLFRTSLFHNDDLTLNTRPPQPDFLSATQVGASVNFKWRLGTNYPTDLKAALSYNVFVGNAPQDDSFDPAMARLASGKRYLARRGHIADSVWTISDLAPGNYWWSVQSIDGDWEGSDFGAADNFTVLPTVPPSSVFTDQTSTGFSGILPPPSGLTDNFLAWGDYNNDGNMDLITGGNAGVNGKTTIYRNTGLETFTSGPAVVLPAVTKGDAVWVDLNQDSYLDLVLCGQVSPNAISEVYMNSGPPLYNFTLNTAASASIPGFRDGSIDVGDVDNDGDPDLLFTGFSPLLGGPRTRIYLNQYTPGSPGSVDFVTGYDLAIGVEFSDAKFGDFDNDGWLDFAVAGLPNNVISPVTKVYQNDADGTGNYTEYSSALANIVGVRQGCIAWGDVDNNGFLDLLISGNTGGGPVTKLYRYLEISGVGGIFAAPLNSGFVDLMNGSVAFGDYDDDGFVDVVITGEDGNGAARSLLYKNKADQSVSFDLDFNSSATLTDVKNGSNAIWGDFTGDIKLDLVLAGGASGGDVLKLYKNIDINANLSPLPPSNLDAKLQGFTVVLTWDKPTITPIDVGDGVSYNLYIDGPLSGSTDIRSPMAKIPGGFRRIVSLGAAQLSKEMILTNLEPGTYSWGVQTIDQDFEGSSFASGPDFTYEDPTYTNPLDSIFVSGQIPPGLRNAAFAWGDYTGDGHLDFVISGQNGDFAYYTALYFYDPVGEKFAEDPNYSNQLIDVREGSLAWGDMDRDGDMDLLITGMASSGRVARVYRNLNGAFISNNFVTLAGVNESDAVWADIENDGDLDIFLMGHNGTTDILRVYRNQGAGSFLVETPVSGFGLSNGEIAVGDYNQDSYVDVLVLGEEGGVARTRLYENLRGNGFQQTAVTGLTNLRASDAAWGDYNADGFLDLAIAGRNNTNNRFLRIFKNNGAGNFNSPINLSGIEEGDIAWGDYNNDGHKDLVVSGQDGPTAADRSVNLYRYDPVGDAFVSAPVAGAALPPMSEGTALAWGDYDQDGKLDLAALGQADTGAVFAIFHNIIPVDAWAPDPPTGLTASIEGNDMVFSWTAPDPPIGLPNTIKKGFSYNLYVGSTPGSIDVRAPESDMSTGRRRLVFTGRVNDTTKFRLSGLNNGTYYWSVQTIDADFTGSPFALEENFFFETPTFVDSTIDLLGGVVPDGLDQGDLSWVDFDNDDDLDLLIMGKSTSSQSTDMLENQGSQGFARINTGLPNIFNSRGAWADVDLDGDMDLALMGQQGNGNRILGVYLNNNGNFSSGNAINLFLPSGAAGLDEGDLAWGDFDNDGDPDLLVMGNTGNQLVTQLYRNEPATNSLNPIDLNLPGLYKGSVDWVDFNRDGYLDFLLTGRDDNSSRVARIYRSRGNGGFDILLPTGLSAGIDESSADWGDFNHDGYPDLAICGQTNGGVISRVLINNNGNNFTSKSLRGVKRGRITWGDYNDDGRMDLVLTGETAAGGRLTQVYRTLPNGDFLADSIATLPLVNVNEGSAIAWGDFNQDGKLDLGLIGRSNNNPQERALRIYANVNNAQNTTLSAPEMLQDTVIGDTVFLSWSPPAGFPGIQEGFTYNLYVGTSPKGIDIVSPWADLATNSNGFPNGFRRVAQSGNAGNSLIFKLFDLDDGVYYWSVQAIDADFEPSAFASEEFFSYVAPTFVNVSAEVLSGQLPNGFSRGEMAWADYDRDQDLDLLVSGVLDNLTPATVLIEQENGKFFANLVPSDSLINVEFSAIAWGDYDLDGDLDLAISGKPAAGLGIGNFITLLYKNLGNKQFSIDRAASQSLMNVNRGSLDWGDYDRDGDLDLALMGQSANGPFTGVYRNDQGSFSLDSSLNLVQVSQGELAWGDYDADGYLDLALCGAQGIVPYTGVYHNQGARGGLVEISNTPALTGVKEGSLAWADFDNDGDLDLAIMGNSSPNLILPITRLYPFNSNQNKFDSPKNFPENVFNGDLAWGDVDDDGDPDLLIAGQDNVFQSDRISSLYINNNGNFLRDDATSRYMFGANDGADFAMADFDLDGKLDMTLMGQTADTSPRRSLTFYQNIDPNANLTAGAPQSPTTLISADSVYLSWQAPNYSGDEDGLSYSVFIARSSDDQLLMNPDAATSTGFREVVRAGNAGQTLALSLRDIPGGKYYWKVQAVEQDFEGSDFSVADTFIFIPPIFVEVNTYFLDGGVDGFSKSSVAWGDYDNDGDLDLALSGEQDGNDFNTLLLRNEGETQMVPDAAILLTGIRGGVLAWGDYNADGWIDLLVSGESSAGRFTEIYTNNQGLSFTPLQDADIPPLRASRGAWGDADNDGDLDLLLSGNSLNGNLTQLFINDQGDFQEKPIGLPGFQGGDLSWVDYDNDGLLDIVLSGSDGGPLTAVYHNVGDADFDEVLGSGLPALRSTRLDWGDFDNNGFPDLLISGLDGSSNPVAGIYLYDANQNTFVASTVNVPDYARGEAIWGDFNNDDFLDFVISGENGSGQVETEVYRNTGLNDFAKDQLASEPLNGLGDLGDWAWGDLNGDGKLDLVATGESAGMSMLLLYRNDESSPNTRPGPPEELAQTLVSTNVQLSWVPPKSFDPAKVAGLTYNLFIGTQLDSSGVKSPMAAIQGDERGYRRVVEIGNVGQVQSWVIQGDELEKGNTYFWGVQAIGHDYEGSLFATDKFTFNPPAYEETTGDLFPGGVPAGLRAGVVNVVDYDQDGDLDFFAAGEIGPDDGESYLYENTTTPVNGGRFVRDETASTLIDDLLTPAADWGDYDRDGDLDLVLCGLTEGLNGERLTVVYRNDGGSFTLDTQASDDLANVYQGSLDWGDYDKDGDLDLVLAGDALIQGSPTPITYIYRNIDGRFERDEDAFAPGENTGIEAGSVKWGDFDRDSHLDLLVSGNSSFGPFTGVYRNQGDATFKKGTFGTLEQVQSSSGDWGDVNNDGYLDLVLAGNEAASPGFSPFTLIYRYDASGDQFLASDTLEATASGKVLWGDYNNDGWQDVVISGRVGNVTEGTTRLYQNQEGITLSEDLFSSNIFTNLTESDLAWIDFNNNGKLDLISIGNDDTGAGHFAVYQNIDTTTNTRPDPPQSLSVDVNGPTTRLAWQAPAGADPTIQEGYSYTLYLGLQSNPASVVSPHADSISGIRWVLQMGNQSTDTTIHLDQLPDGTYFWGVQTLDQAFEGSLFAIGPSFEFTNPVPEIKQEDFADLYPLGGSPVQSSICVKDTSVIAEVAIIYKGIAAANWQERIIATQDSVYVFDISDVEVDEMGVEYFFVVRGKFGFDVQSSTGYTHLIYPDGFAYDNLTFGKRVTDYNIIAVPLELSNAQISQVIEEEFGAYDIFEWRFWHYQNGENVEFQSGLNNIEPGKGYWLITKEDRSFSTGEGRTVDAHDGQPFVINLSQGWNQIGNPYPYNLLWSEMVDSTGNGADSLLNDPYSYSRNGFISTKQINQFRGVLVFAPQAMALQVPVRKNLSINRHDLEPDVSVIGTPGESHWELPIVLQSGPLTYPLGGIGMHERARLEGKDRFDRMTPPPPAEFLELNFNHPEYFSPRFTRDVVPLQKSHVWEFTVASNLDERLIELHWENTHFLANGLQLYLFDLERQRFVNMGEQSSYRSYSKQTRRRFRIYFGDQQFINQALQPDRIHLGEAYPNPAAAALTIPFNLPEDAGISAVELSLFNPMGQKLLTLTEGTFAPGFHEIPWSGRDQSGRRLAAGVYVYQLQVKSHGQTYFATKRLILK